MAELDYKNVKMVNKVCFIDRIKVVVEKYRSFLVRYTASDRGNNL